ncbi:MAG: SDR family NAD(P)-dependent oxidoreductase [Pseudomonadota bacterium]
MQKTILITGSTDGIGLEAARTLVAEGHHVLLHGRNHAKLQDAHNALSSTAGNGQVDAVLADLSVMKEVDGLADAVAQKYEKINVLINNAGVYDPPQPLTQDGLDARFAVNTIAPYLLTQRLSPMLGPSGRVINISSAAQSPVDLEALAKHTALSDMEAYSQSKLALMMWSRHIALQSTDTGPMIVSVNPGSMLGTKMVKDAFGVAGNDIQIGADILCRAATSDEFAEKSGQYFDNDAQRFADPHPDGLDSTKNGKVVAVISEVLARLS